MRIRCLLVFSLVIQLIGQVGFAQSDDGRSRCKRNAGVFDVKFGFLGGFGRSWQTGSDFVVKSNSAGDDFESFTKFKGIYGTQVGGFMDIKFDELKYLQLEARLVSKGWRQEGPFQFSPASTLIDSFPNFNKVEYRARYFWLDIPLRYKFKVHKRFFGLVGPFVGIKLLEKFKITDDFGNEFVEPFEYPVQLEALNYGLGLGFSYQLKSGLFFIVDYKHGIADLANYESISGVPTPKYNNVSVHGSVGYTVNYFQRFTNYRRRGKGKL